jgi:hypothetical protein
LGPIVAAVPGVRVPRDDGLPKVATIGLFGRHEFLRMIQKSDD